MQHRWECPPAEWQAILARIPTATFFQSLAWAETYACSGRGRYDVLAVTWADGRQAVVPIGIRPTWRGLGRAAAIGFDGGYGGILATGAIDPDEMAWLVRLLSRRYGDWAVTTHPFDPPVPETFPVPLARAGPTLAVPLAPLDDLRHRYDNERRRAVRRYQEDGITVAVSHDRGRCDIFWRLYRQAAAGWRRMGRPATWIRDEAWFRTLWQCAGDHLTLLLARRGAEIIGAEILAIQGRIAVELFSVWDRQAAAHQVTTALTEAALAESFARGCILLDGMPSGVLRGVERFKASFGAVAYPIWQAHRQAWTSVALARAQALYHGLLSAGTGPATAMSAGRLPPSPPEPLL